MTASCHVMPTEWRNRSSARTVDCAHRRVRAPTSARDTCQAVPHMKSDAHTRVRFGHLTWAQIPVGVTPCPARTSSTCSPAWRPTTAANRARPPERLNDSATIRKPEPPSSRAIALLPILSVRPPRSARSVSRQAGGYNDWVERAVRDRFTTKEPVGKMKELLDAYELELQAEK